MTRAFAVICATRYAARQPRDIDMSLIILRIRQDYAHAADVAAALFTRYATY